MKINHTTPDKQNFLQILDSIAVPPKKLYYIGELPQERKPTVAIVGTRKPTAYGKEVTTHIAGALAAKGVVIISGLALGVDGLAHRAALEANGTTLAVLGNGLGEVYPSSHRELAKQILAKGGALISEYEPSRPALPHQFLERNRLVSGLADAIIITEAAARSGTLNTAAHALEQGKDIYVVPGNITSPMSAGCNRLLEQGARPLLSVDDLLNDLVPENDSAEQTMIPLGDTKLERDIIAAIIDGMRDGDSLIEKCGVDPAEFNVAITMLEINGVVRALGNNQWRLR